MKIYAANNDISDLATFSGTDLWVKVLYRGFYTTNYEYIRIADIDEEHIWFNSLNVYAVNKLVGSALSIMNGDPASFDDPIDSIREAISAPPRSTLTYLYHLCTPVDVYTTEELLLACDTLENYK